MSMQGLGKLLCDLNPYTGRTNPVSGRKTGEMDIYVDAPANGATAPDLSQVEIEVDTQYPGNWEFKGASHRINTSARIRYRYPVMDAATGKVVYWIDDYLLVGYEGAGGP
jgi:hypothetical protein